MFTNALLYQLSYLGAFPVTMGILTDPGVAGNFRIYQLCNEFCKVGVGARYKDEARYKTQFLQISLLARFQAPLWARVKGWELSGGGFEILRQTASFFQQEYTRIRIVLEKKLSIILGKRIANRQFASIRNCPTKVPWFCSR